MPPQTTSQPDKPSPSPGTDPQTDLAAQWKSFDPDRRTRLLSKMSPEQKSSLRKLLEAKPAAAPTPSAPVPGFLARMSERVAGGLHGLNEAITKSIASLEPNTPEHRELVQSLQRGKLSPQGEQYKSALTQPGVVTPYATALAIPAHAVYETVAPMIKEWHDPANLAGDVLTMYMLGGGELPKFGRGKPTTTARPEPPLVPREVPAPGTGIDTPTGYPHGLTGEQWTGYVDKVNKAYHEHLQDLSDYASKEAKARAKYVRNAYGATQKIADQVEAINQRDILNRGSREYTNLARNNIRDVHQTVRARLDSRWNQFREEMAGSTVDATQVGQVIQEAQSKLRGSPADLKLFNDLLRESGVEVSDTGEIVMGPEADPNMPVDTLRVHSSAIGDKLASGNLPGNVYQALKLAKEGSEGLIEEAADARGQGSTYRSLKADWSRYMRDWNDMRGVATGKGSVLARALRVPDPSYLRGLITGTGGDLLLETFGQYRDAGANPDLVSNARSLAKQSAAIKVPKGAATEIPTTVRERLQTANVGKYEPGPPPKLKEVPVPKPEPTAATTKAPRWARAAGKITGKLIGAKALGLKGYVVGGEVGEAAAEKIYARKSPAPTPMTGPQGTPEIVPPPSVGPNMAVPPGMRSFRTTTPTPAPTGPSAVPNITNFTGEWEMARPEEDLEAARRRGTGGPSPAERIRMAYDQLNSLKMRLAREEAAGDPGRYNTVSKIQQAEEDLANLQRSGWGPGYEGVPKSMTRSGEGGANYTADQLAEFKRKHGIK